MDDLKKNSVTSEAMENISERLSSMENLYFPRALLTDAGGPSQRKSLLLDLLSRDAAVFLERYGSKLTKEELREFEVLREDYEINWHLAHLRTMISPTSEELRSRSVTVKNRRRAYMDKLVNEGNYFSEEEMREREPYLHYEMVGKFQVPIGRSMARPGERWSDTLMRRAEEAMLVAKIRGEQQRLGVDEKDWVGNEGISMEEEMEVVETEEEMEEVETEEEEDEEEKEEVKVTNSQEKKEEVKVTNSQEKSKVCSLNDHDHFQIAPSDVRKASETASFEASQDSEQGSTQATATTSQVVSNQSASLSEEDMQDQMDHFTHIMQQKFLSGEDHEYLDYSKIDQDQTLDDHWLREANYDAEEKYFEED